METKKCKQCKLLFSKPDWASPKRWEELAYCNTSCSAKWNANHRDNTYLEARFFKKGHVPANKGKKLSKEFIETHLKGENNPNWKDNPGYKAIHKWINEKYPRTGTCARCKEKKKTQYACFTKEYSRRAVDYLELCVSCHTRFDRGRITLIRMDVNF